jgi:hypothetical protein
LKSILEKLEQEGKIKFNFVKVDEGTDSSGNATNINRLEMQKIK